MVTAFYEYFKTANGTLEGCSSVSYFLPGIQELKRDQATK